MEQCAFVAVAGEGCQRGGVAETKLADVDEVGVSEGGWVRGKVPRFHLVLAHLDAGEVAHAGDFGLVLCHGTAGAEFFDFFLAGVGFVGVVDVLCGGEGGWVGGFGGGGGVLDVGHFNVRVLTAGVVRLRGVGFGAGGGDFGRDDGDLAIASGEVLFPAGGADEGRAGGSLGIAAGGGELGLGFGGGFGSSAASRAGGGVGG